MNHASAASGPSIATISDRRYGLLWIAIVAVYLFTFSDRYFGLISDGQMMLDTAVSLHEFAELKIGPEIDPNNGAILRPSFYGKYGLGNSIILQIPLLLATPVEKIFGKGRSNALFPLTNLLLTALTALLIAFCLRDLRCRFQTIVLAALGFAFGTFAWPYISFDFSEPLQALTAVAPFWILLHTARRSDPSLLHLCLAARGRSPIFTKR